MCQELASLRRDTVASVAVAVPFGDFSFRWPKDRGTASQHDVSETDTRRKTFGTCFVQGRQLLFRFWVSFAGGSS